MNTANAPNVNNIFKTETTATNNGMKRKSSVSTSRKFPAKSQALLYEVHLKELYQRYPKRPCRERVLEVFKIFDEVIPQSGNVQKVLELIRDELYESVFSKFFTSSKVEPFIERIPFFETSEKMTTMRKEEVQKTNETFQELKDRINDKNYELSIVYRKNLAYKQDNIEKEKIIKDLKEKYVDVESKLKSSEGERLLLKTTNNNQVEVLKSEINLLKTSLEDAGKTINRINIFRDELDNWKFINEKNYREKTPIDLISIAKKDKKETLIIYDQLSGVINSQIDEYEGKLERLKQKKDNNVISNDNYLEELKKVMDGFRNRIRNLFEEQEQLKSHYKRLNEIINNYNSNSNNKFSKTNALVSSINKVFSIVVIYSVDNGFTYRPIESVEFCHKCKAKTAICPHKPFDTNIEIPKEATDVRLVHPDLFVYSSDSNSMEEITYSLESEDIEGKPINIKEITKIPTFQKIWKEYFYKYNGVKPLVSREFPSTKLVNIIWEVFNARYIVEENPFFKDDEKIKTFSETFYEYVEKKYVIEKISKFVLHDIILGLQINESLPFVTLFSRTLSGEEDCSWKYYYLLSQFIRSCNNFNGNNISKIFKTIYPIKSDSFYEELEFDYQSFCKGKSTKDSFLDYILFLIKKQAEPNYLFFLEVLHRYDHRKNNFLEFAEYIEFVNQLVQKASYNMVDLQYRISEQVIRKPDRVPLERLSYITCYLFMVTVKKHYQWNFLASLTKEYFNHSNISFLDNMSIDELNRVIEKSKLESLDPEAIDREMEKMSEKVDLLLRQDGIDMDVVNECLEQGKPIPDDLANEIIRRECAKRFPSNTELKVKEHVQEIMEEKEKNNKLFASDESLDENSLISKKGTKDATSNNNSNKDSDTVDKNNNNTNNNNGNGKDNNNDNDNKSSNSNNGFQSQKPLPPINSNNNN